MICTASKSFAVGAATLQEKEEWMRHIKNCIDNLLRKSKLNCSRMLLLVRYSFDSEKLMFGRRQEAFGNARSAVGARFGSCILHGVQKVAIHRDQPASPLPEVRRCRLRTLLQQKASPAEPEFQTSPSMLVLLRRASEGSRR